jgi:predicted GIY-YIG superfamily endonuclease
MRQTTDNFVKRRLFLDIVWTVSALRSFLSFAFNEKEIKSLGRQSKDHKISSDKQHSPA